MRISPLRNISFKSNNNNVNKNNSSKEHKGVSNTTKLALGVGGSVLLGFATYFVLRGKTVEAVSKSAQQIDDGITKTLSGLKSDVEDLSSKFVLKLKNGGTKVQFSTPVKDDADTLRDILIFDKSGNLEKRIVSRFDVATKETVHRVFKGDASQIIDKPDEIDKAFLVKEVTIENFKPFLKDSLERNTTIKHADNTVTQYQDFYRKGKLYERYVYNNYEGELRDTDKVVRYNFAYENDKVAAVARQDIFKDGHQHGIYSDGGFNPFPILIKKTGEKEFSKLDDIYSFEPLCEFDSRFDPENL